MSNKNISKVDIVCSNLQARQTSVNNNYEIRHAYLRELASVLTSMDSSDVNIIHNIRQEYKTLTCEKLSLSQKEKHILCYYISEEMGKKFDDCLEMFILDPSFTPRRLCYVKNHYSDIAYRVFDNALDGVTSEYADSFDLAAQSVFYENCSGCILPYESEGGGVMTGIRTIAEKYDLNKACVCHVDAGGQMTKFVLFTRGIWVNKDANKLEFTVITPSFFHCSDLIEAGMYFGFKDGGIISTSFSDEDERTSTFSFTGGESNMRAMLLYLSLEYERSRISGIYNEIVPFKHHL